MNYIQTHRRAQLHTGSSLSEPIQRAFVKSVLFVLCFGVVLQASMAAAAEPVIKSVSPQAVRPGETAIIKVSGSSLASATKLWTSFPCEVALAPESAEHKKSAAQVFFQITVPEQTPTGLQGVRVLSPNGVSALKLLVVDDIASIPTAGNNKSQVTAQEIKVPAAIDGYVGSLETRYFKFNAPAKQKISVEVLARRLGSPLDPILMLLDAKGRELVYADDTLGLGGDLQLTYEIPAAGDYFLALRDIQYRGSAAYTYRLRVGDFPCLQTPYPLVAQRGQSQDFGFSGLNVDGVPSQSVAVSADKNVLAQNVAAKRDGGSSNSWASLALSDSPQFLEAEPNNQPAEANSTSLGTGLNGILQAAGDVDRFRLTAVKGQKFRFIARTRSLGAPTDLYMRLEDAKGKQLAAVDDTGTNDGQLTYTFPADGEYVLAVRDLNHRGGSQFVYHVDVVEAKPGFILQASADRLNIPAGGTALITVNSTRVDFGGPIELSIEGLPEGVVASKTVIGPGRNDAIVSVTATKEITAGSFSEVKVVGSGKVGETAVTSQALVGNALSAQWSNTPLLPGHLAKSTVSNIIPAAPYALSLPASEVIFGRNLKTSFKIAIQRGEGIDQAVTLAVLPDAKKGLPAGITAKVNPIAAKANEAVVELTANDKVALGEYTIAVRGAHKKGKATITQSAPAIRIRIAEPLTAKLSIGQPKLAAGGTAKGKVTVDRNPALKGEVVLAFQNLPKGVTVPAIKIPADKSEVEFVLTAAADATVGAVKNLTVKADVVVAKKTFTATSAAIALDVQPKAEKPKSEKKKEAPKKEEPKPAESKKE